MNMDVGSEISNKIRSAIKAKLVELNAYVDEELPDYIMVMVANKKSQLQMADDLGLFLGPNTEKFTTWLHGLLLKLQTITSETSAAIFGSSKPEKPVEKSKEQTSGEVLMISKRKCNEKQSAEESKLLKNRALEDVLDERKSRKRRSDPNKKSRIGDDDNKRQVSDKGDESDTVIVVVASDSVTTNATSLSGSGAVAEKDSNDSIPLSSDTDGLQLEETSRQIVVSENVELDSVDTKTVEGGQEELVQTVKPSHSKEGSKTTDIGDIQVEDDDLTELLLTENDELTEELEQETVVVLPVRKKSSSWKGTLIQVSDEESSTVPKTRGTSSVIGSNDSSKDSSPPRSSRPRAVASPIRQTGCRAALVRAVEPRPSEQLSRKKRGPVSVIGSITQNSDEEEGYDPRNPAVGSVASVVKVTARKSSVPPKLQANKSLLLKAMTEAEKSVETQRRVAVTPVRPFMRSEGRDTRDRDRDRERERERERDRNHERRGHASSSSRDSRRHSPTARIAQASLRQAISQPRSSRLSPPVYIPTRKVQPAPRMESGSDNKVGIVSKSRRQAEEQRAWLDRDEEPAPPPRKSVKQAGKAVPIVNFVIEADYNNVEEDPPRQLQPPRPQPQPQPQPQPEDSSSTKVKKEPVSPKRKLPYVEPPQGKHVLDSERDSRVVEYEPEIVVASPAERSLSESGSQGIPALLEDMDQDQEEFLLDQDVLDLTESSTTLLEEDQRQAMVKDKSKDRTRFVVTLDGVDTDQYDASTAMETEFAEEEMEVDKLQAGKTGLPQPPSAMFAPQFVSKDPPLSLMTPPKIQPLNISLKDSDEEGEAMETEMITPLKQAKMMERCKFWPACVNGSSCEYHHPTIHCKTFPMCKFGDKCLYIHPNCRFDSKCMRPDCPFTHSSLRSIPPPVPAPPFQGTPYIMMKPAYRAPAPVPAPGLLPAGHGMGTTPQCKFFPKCTNMACPFFHPKPCHFGLNCKHRERGCPFFHPALPSVDKLTWVAASKEASALPVGADKGKEAKKVE